MGGMHFSQVINDCIDLSVYSEGIISYEEAINMGVDETPYLIHIYRKRYESKDKAKQEFIKSCFEYASTGLKELFKALQNLGKRNNNG